MAKDYDKEDGVWRTIGGRKVFIRKGQNLADAMIESGKFKGQKNKPGMRESYRKEKEKDIQEEEEKFENLKNLGVKTERNEEEIVKAQDELISKYRENRERYPIKQQEEVDENKTSLREQYRENKNYEDSLKDDYDKDFLRKAKAMDDYDKGKLNEKEYEYVYNNSQNKRYDDLVEEAKSQKDKSTNDYKEQSRDFVKQHGEELYKNEEDYNKSLNKYMTEHGELGGIQGNFLVYNSDENDFYKAKLEHDKEYLKDKSTNETMNNAIREKASKKTWRDDLREANEKTTQELIDENKSLYKEFGGFADTGDKQKNQEVEKAHAKWLQNKTLIQEHDKQGNNYRNALTKLNDKSIKDGTYDLDTGEAVDFKGVGYNVSFEQTGDNYTNGEYYDKINECRNKCDGKVYGGKFDGTPELSFYTKNIDDAIEVAEKYNQHSVWDIEINDYYYNPFYDESKNKVGIKAQENDDWVRRSFERYKKEHPNTKINSIKDYMKMKKKK